MEMQSFNRVTEAGYLTASNAWSYRAILRYFYIQHERMREFLFPEEIHAYLKEQPDFHTYSIEDLHQDLDQLVKWNNLVARQETGRSRTIEEFKKKRFRYQCTPYTVEFERMLSEMEKGGEVFGGSLEKKEFDRLYQSLLKVEQAIRKKNYPTADECAELWGNLFTNFRSITQNTSDYIAHINSEEAEERMQTEAFLVFKDQFTTYLRDFIIGLQQTAFKIQKTIRTIDLEMLKPFINQVIIHQQSIPRFEEITSSKEERLEDEQEKWQNLSTWFLGNEHSESELVMLEERTNEQIRRITRVVQRLGERHDYFRSRKKDYLYLSKWFDSLESIREAHELSAIVFGVFHTRHLFSDQIPSDDIYTSIWDEKPIEHETNPRIRNYREKTRPGAIISNQKKKEETKQAFLLNKQIEQDTLEKYMVGNKMILAELPVIEPYFRKMLLNWLGKAMIRKDRTFKTEYGQTVRALIKPDERIILHSEDGELEMPSVTFKFIEEVKT